MSNQDQNMKKFSIHGRDCPCDCYRDFTIEDLKKMSGINMEDIEPLNAGDFIEINYDWILFRDQ